MPDVVDQNSDLAEAVHRVPNYPANIPGRRQIGGNGQNMVLRPDAGQLNLGTAQVGFGAGRDGNTGALVSKRHGDRSADAPAGAADYGDAFL